MYQTIKSSPYASEPVAIFNLPCLFLPTDTTVKALAHLVQPLGKTVWKFFKKLNVVTI